MWVREEIAATITRLGVEAGELSPEEMTGAEELLELLFARPGRGPLWERLRESAGVHDPEGWQHVAGFVAAPLLLLVRDAQGACGFRFEKSTDLVRVLAECSGFEFYVTDGNGNYLLAFNHHDVLIGAGSAAAWVRTLGRS